MHQTLLGRLRPPDRRCRTLNKCSFYGGSVLVIPPPYGVEHESQKVANLQPHERSIIEKPNLQANKTTMTSNALSDWQTVRFVRLDELFSIVGPSQRLDLIEVLVMRLAAEWQGFLRQFHDEITELFVAQFGLVGAPAQITNNLITYRREIDMGNANADALANDLSMFGVDLWATLRHFAARSTSGKGASPSVEQMKRTLTLLNQARNAAAHDDEARRQKMKLAGIVLSVDTLKEWRNLLNQLATALDQSVPKQIEFPKSDQRKQPKEQP
jgi:hypothetical protein